MEKNVNQPETMTQHDATHAPDRYAFIDALRGYAILAVIAFHVSYNVTNLDASFRRFASAGSAGVQLFFVVSALTMMLSWHARADGIRAFYIRRVFRIAPMFWLSIPVFLALRGFVPWHWSTSGTSWGDVVASIFFVNGWHPESINNVVFGGWSVAVEMTFYLVFPVLVFFLRSLKRALAALIGAVLLLSALNPLAAQLWSLWSPGMPATQIDMFTLLWFWNQLPVFIVGIGVFFLLRDVNATPALLSLGIILSIGLAGMIKFFPFAGLETVMYALCFGLLTFCLGKGAGKVLVNRVICQIGKVSFSAYLWHSVVLSLLFRAPRWTKPLGLYDPTNGIPFYICLFIGVTAITVLLSAFTCRFVERPMIAIGNRVARSAAIRP